MRTWRNTVANHVATLRRPALFAFVIGLTAQALTGCMVGPVGDEKTKAPFFVRGEMGFKYVHWKAHLPSQKRFVPIHPADGGVPGGNVGVLLDMTDVSGPFQMGVQVATTFKTVRPYAGLSLRLNHFTLADFDSTWGSEQAGDDDWDASINSVKQQPVGDDSYGYGMIKPSVLTPIPKIGVEVDLTDNILLGLEYAKPWSEFTYERGHYRNDHVEAIERDSWRGWADAYSLRLGFSGDGKTVIGIELTRERYDANFAGAEADLDANVFSIFFATKF